MSYYSIGQSEMDQYALMEKKLMAPYAPIPALGEIVETAANDPFWQEYGLPSLEGLGFSSGSFMSHLVWLGLAASAAYGGCWLYKRYG